MVEQNLPIDLGQRRAQMENVSRGKPQNILQFPGAQAEDESEIDPTVPISTLRVLYNLIWNPTAIGEDLIAGLDPDENGNLPTSAQAFFGLRSAVRRLTDGDSQSLQVGPEIMVADNLKAFRFINGYIEPDVFDRYIFHRLSGRPMLRRERSAESKALTEEENNEAIVEEVHEELVVEAKIPVSLPKLDRPAAKHRVERLMTNYEQLVKLYQDSLWQKDHASWEEVRDQAKIRQRAKRVLERIEVQLEGEVNYDEGAWEQVKQKIHALTDFDNQGHLSVEEEKLFQRKLNENQSYWARRDTKPDFEKRKGVYKKNPLRVVIGHDEREAIVGDNIVVFGNNEVQWQLFLRLTNRRKGAVPSTEVRDIVEAEGRPIDIVNKLRRLIGDDLNEPHIITVDGDRNKASYIFKPTDVEPFTPRPVEMQAGESVTFKPEKPQFDSPEKPKGKLKLETKDPNYEENLTMIALEVLDANLPARASLTRVAGAFGSLVIKRILRQLESGIIDYELGSDNQHPLFNKYQIAKMLYGQEMGRKGKGLTKKEAEEVSELLSPIFAELEKLEQTSK